MAKTQINKATSFHLGTLKAKLAKLKRELLNPTVAGGGGGAGAGFDVARTGIASVGFIGFPSVGTWPRRPLHLLASWFFLCRPFCSPGSLFQVNHRSCRA